MNVQLSGIHRVRKTLSDGTIRTYYYASRGGPRITAEYGSPEFVAEYLALKPKAPPNVKADTVDWLITQYISSRDFDALAVTTKREYRRYLRQISKTFGSAPLRTAVRPDAISAYRRWHRSMEEYPRTANYALSVLKKLMSWSVDSGNSATNPTVGIRPLKENGTRCDIIWTHKQIAAFNGTAPRHVSDPFNIALYTSQRKKDIIEMTWDAYDGETLKFMQSKTGKRVWIKASDEVKGILDRIERQHERVFLNSYGEPWTLSGYDSSFRDAKKEACVTGVTFHDTRGTAITLAYIGGASFRDIALMSGHSEQQVERMINAHYLSRDVATEAINAMKSVNYVNSV